MFKVFSILAMLCSTQLFSKPGKFPQFIDFGDLKLQDSYYFDPSQSWTWKLGYTAYKEGLTAFNEAPEIGAFIIALESDYRIDAVVETGTYRGATTQFFAKYFKEVHSVEVSESFYSSAEAIFSSKPHVHCHLGSSETVLKKILPALQSKRILFYLDAHWYSYLPLLEELEEICKTHKDNCIIVIDDFKVPGRSDLVYEKNDHVECSYDFIKTKLNEIFTEYTVHYLIPKNPKSNAKFVAIPSKWKRI